MKNLYSVFLIFMPLIGFCQPTNIQGITTNQSAVWSLTTKAQSDSCGSIFNNYIGLSKLNIIRQEPMKTGISVVQTKFSGRAQRFEAPQDVEIGGVEFYAYIKDNPTQDSIMVITALNEYDVLLDSVSTELTRDTVYVKHHSFSSYIPSMSVKSYFDTPITMSTDYVVSIQTPTDDSLFIIANDPFTNAGNGENLGHAFYGNTNNPAFVGWYSMFGGDLGSPFDYDFLIAPLVKYKLQNGFTLDNDTVCPGVLSNACVNYNQQVIFSNGQYNQHASTNTSSINWLWGDNTFNSGLSSACHTYQNLGTHILNLTDTIFNWDYSVSHCVVDLQDSVFVLEHTIPNFTFTNSHLTADFTNTSIFSDSISWEFGDGSTEGNVNTPSHTFPNSNVTYEVWLFAYSACNIDSIMYQVTTDNVGIVNFKNSISIYPNPANQNLLLNNLPSHSLIEIYNLIGEKIISFNNNSDNTVVSTTDLANGTYILKVNNENQQLQQKIVIQH